MLLTIATTDSPATELGFLLHKHPEPCTAALLLDVDPVKLVRGKGARLEKYVASSFLSLAK